MGSFGKCNVVVPRTTTLLLVSYTWTILEKIKSREKLWNYSFFGCELTKM